VCITRGDGDGGSTWMPIDAPGTRFRRTGRTRCRGSHRYTARSTARERCGSGHMPMGETDASRRGGARSSSKQEGSMRGLRGQPIRRRRGARNRASSFNTGNDPTHSPTVRASRGRCSGGQLDTPPSPGASPSDVSPLDLVFPRSPTRRCVHAHRAHRCAGLIFVSLTVATRRGSDRRMTSHHRACAPQLSHPLCADSTQLKRGAERSQEVDGGESGRTRAADAETQ
jgi:hypothetical protein